VILDQQQTDERAEAIRTLLADPMPTREADPDRFRLLAIHRDWLATYFDRYCGWTFTLDVTGGTARLTKRRATLDPPRPATRPGDDRPFDATRYVLLMCVAAELVARPHTTISDLADAVGVACAADEVLFDFDPADHRQRGGFADVLRWLLDRDIVTITAGALDQYTTQGRDAVLEADVARLAALPASTRAPSRIVAADTDGWLSALTAEPRYGDLDADATADQRNLWARHTLIRAVLDDPAVDLDQLDRRVVDYLATPTGRQLLTDAVADAGLSLERHADVIVAVDEHRHATDQTFGERASTLAQVAGVLLAELSGPDRTGRTHRVAQLEGHVADLLAADPGWAKGYQDPGGARRLTTEALDQLVAFGLARRDHDTVHPRPAAARFAVTVTDARHHDPAAPPPLLPDPELP
jgi:uncharacterized protein (TIGR02678 family)